MKRMMCMAMWTITLNIDAHKLICLTIRLMQKLKYYFKNIRFKESVYLIRVAAKKYMYNIYYCINILSYNILFNEIEY